MTAHNVDTAQWAYMLAPQLTGKAQQAFAAMPSTSSGSYDQVKTVTSQSCGLVSRLGGLM